MTNEAISVEVVYGSSEGQTLLSIAVPPGTTAYEAVGLSGIQSTYPQINPDENPIGIFAKLLDGKGRPTAKDYVLQTGDRVEIYRPLQIDPKQARLARAAKKSSSKINSTRRISI